MELASVVNQKQFRTHVYFIRDSKYASELKSSWVDRALT